MRTILYIACGMFVVGPALEEGVKTSPKYERDFQAIIAKKMRARTEVTLFDGTRVDLMFLNYACEIDFAKKWAEGCGQAKYYSQMTDRDGVLILLMNDRLIDRKYAYRAAIVCQSTGLDLWLWDMTKSDWIGVHKPP